MTRETKFGGGDLPRGWRRTALGEVCDAQKGLTPMHLSLRHI